MALLLLEGNNCAKLFWNHCINVQVMSRTSSIYDHFDLYLTPMTLTFNLPEKMFQMALLLLEGNMCAKLFWNACNKCTSYGPDKLNIWPFYLYLTPVTLKFNLPKKRFQIVLLLLKVNYCAKLFWNPCIIVQVMVRTNPHGRTHIHRTKIVTTMCRLPASGLDKNVISEMSLWCHILYLWCHWYRSMADSVCHAPPNLKWYQKLKSFQ